ncbi:MAG: DUF4388 domain-containing protein [Chloroflexota bacterium]
MPYTGDLRRIGVQRLLGILAGGRKSGLLKIRGREALDIYVRHGRVAQARPVKGQALAETLLELSTTKTDERDAVRRLAAGEELGTALMLDFLQVSTRERSISLLREQALAAIRRTAEWQKGDIRFEPAVVLPNGRLDLSLPFARLSNRD